MVKRLTIYSDLYGFFRRLKKGDVFTYSEAFDLDTIYELAHEQGRMVQYCDPSMPEYREHGCFTCRVTWTKRNASASPAVRWYHERH